MIILGTCEVVGRGTVITVKPDPKGWCPKAGETVRIRQPSGLVVPARIRGAEMIHFMPEATEEQRAMRGFLINLPADGLVGCEMLSETQ